MTAPESAMKPLQTPLAVTCLLVNAFFGWTLIGWIVALIWAYTSNTRPEPDSTA